MVYLIPLVILITANTTTLIGLKRMREKIESGIQTALNKKRIEMERRIVRCKRITMIDVFFYLKTNYSFI